MAGITGDFAQLANLRGAVARLQSSGFGFELSQVLGGTILKQLADEFRQSRDPYGRPWRPPLLRPGKPLLDTGRLRAAATSRMATSGSLRSVVVHVPVVYAAVHQYGATIKPKNPSGLLTFKTKGGSSHGIRGRGGWYSLRQAVIPRRQIFPESDTGGLGPIWGKAFAREASALLRRRLEAPGGQAGG